MAVYNKLMFVNTYSSDGPIQDAPTKKQIKKFVMRDIGFARRRHHRRKTVTIPLDLIHADKDRVTDYQREPTDDISPLSIQQGVESAQARRDKSGTGRGYPLVSSRGQMLMVKGVTRDGITFQPPFPLAPVLKLASEELLQISEFCIYPGERCTRPQFADESGTIKSGIIARIAI